MQSVYGTVWFFFLVICPVLTIGAVLVVVLTSKTVAQASLRSAVLLPVLVLALGPVWTEIGPMPWWFSGSKLVSFQGARYLVWQYAVVCAAFQCLQIARVYSLRKRRTLSTSRRGV
jgi:hypothetical protein